MKRPIISRDPPTSSSTLRDSILAAWATNNNTMIFLIQHLPEALWTSAVPGYPQRTVRTIAAHIHNARCAWIRTLGQPHGIAVPPIVDRRRVTCAQLIAAMKQSGRAMANLLDFGCDRNGEIPPTPKYVWRNLPLDVGHVLAYFVAHEGHHRGQIVMLARMLGHRLPPAVVNGIWQWNKLRKSAGAGDVS